MMKKRGADAAPLAAGQDVGVTDQIDVAHRLDAHHTDQFALSLIAPEFDSSGDLAVELLQGHIGFVPAIGRDYAAIGLGGGVDDGEDGPAFVVATGADVAHDGECAVLRCWRSWTKLQQFSRCLRRSDSVSRRTA